jgi:hypothetical protein
MRGLGVEMDGRGGGIRTAVRNSRMVVDNQRCEESAEVI